jgi:hypothetical protein
MTATFTKDDLGKLFSRFVRLYPPPMFGSTARFLDAWRMWITEQKDLHFPRCVRCGERACNCERWVH